MFICVKDVNKINYFVSSCRLPLLLLLLQWLLQVAPSGYITPLPRSLAIHLPIQAIGKSELSQTQTTENCHKFSACRQTMPVLRNIASSMPRCLYASIVVISHCSLPSCSPEFNSHDFCSWSRLFNRMKRLQLITGNAICKLFRLMQFH